jgi:hypothetical protein
VGEENFKKGNEIKGKCRGNQKGRGKVKGKRRVKE